MSAFTEASKRWFASFHDEARKRDLPSASFWAARVDDPLYFSATGHVNPKKNAEGTYKASVAFSAKPWAVDSLLWTTLGGDMGGTRKRTGLRAIGAFAVSGDRFAYAYGDSSMPAALQLDEFVAATQTYEAEVPDIGAFIRRIEGLRAERPDVPHMHVLLLTLCLILDKRVDEAAVIIDEREPIGGNFQVGDEGVWTTLQKNLRASTGIFHPDYELSY